MTSSSETEPLANTLHLGTLSRKHDNVLSMTEYKYATTHETDLTNVNCNQERCPPTCQSWRATWLAEAFDSCTMTDVNRLMASWRAALLPARAIQLSIQAHARVDNRPTTIAYVVHDVVYMCFAEYGRTSSLVAASNCSKQLSAFEQAFLNLSVPALYY